MKITDNTTHPINFIRFHGLTLLVARISTDRMRANGNETGAEQMLALHIEWAEVLHKYETHGIAVKTGRSNAIGEVLALQKAKQTAKPADRAWIDHLLQEQLRALNVPAALLVDPQGSLELN